MPIRRVIACFAIVVLTACAGYTAYWFHVSAQMRKGLEQWADQRRAQGWTVEWDSINQSGYPFHLRVHLDAPRLRSPQGLGWQGNDLSVAARPFNPTAIRAKSDGPHHLDWPGGSATLTTRMARAEINLDLAGVLEDATILLTGAKMDSPSLPGTLTLADLALMVDPLPLTAQANHTTPSLRFSLTGQGLTLPLPENSNFPLDHNVSLVELTGRVLGPLPLPPDENALARWSEDGGTVEVERATLDWSPVAMDADGTVALDPQGQPLMALTARLRGLPQVMDRLVRGGIIDPSAANAAKFLVTMLSKPDPKGPSISVPVSIQDGWLSLGPAKLAPIPPILWGSQQQAR